MKKTLLYALFLAVLAAAAPFLCLLLPKTEGATLRPQPTLTATTAATPTPTAAPKNTANADSGEQTVTLYDSAVGGEITVPVEAFLVGAAACEMPPTWPDAALCAQMVASHSYVRSLGESRFRVNSALCTGWTDEAVLKARWGSDFDEHYTRLQALASRIADQLLYYDGQPAAACYHAVSAGHTEASQNVWLGSLPYLQGVDSPWDTSAPDFEVTIHYTADQLRPMLEELDLTPGDDPAAWFGDAAMTDAGYVDTMQVCGQEIAGTALRSALALRSACFTLAYADDAFAITTHGYGHGVGLSQYGAHAMAEGGAGWQEILTYYFPGCEVERA